MSAKPCPQVGCKSKVQDLTFRVENRVKAEIPHNGNWTLARKVTLRLDSRFRIPEAGDRVPADCDLSPAATDLLSPARRIGQGWMPVKGR